MDQLNGSLVASCRDKETFSLMLTGGRSARSLYHFWNAWQDAFKEIPVVDVFFSDERCVHNNHCASNYRMVMDTFFCGGVPANMRVHQMYADTDEPDGAADRYANLLPDVVDLLLLSVGDDGHIASLFPKGQALRETRRLVVPVFDPRASYERLTITPPVIQRAKKVFVLALGGVKRAIYELAMEDPKDLDLIPARLVLDRTWFFGVQRDAF